MMAFCCVDACQFNTLDVSLTTCRLATTVALCCVKRGAGSTGWCLGFGEDLCSRICDEHMISRILIIQQ